jgi:hypothetical protein
MPCGDARGSPRAASALNQAPNLMDVPVEGFLRRQDYHPCACQSIRSVPRQPTISLWCGAGATVRSKRREDHGCKKYNGCRLRPQSSTGAAGPGQCRLASGRDAQGVLLVIPSARCQRFGSEIEFSQIGKAIRLLATSTKPVFIRRSSGSPVCSLPIRCPTFGREKPVWPSLCMFGSLPKQAR